MKRDLAALADGRFDVAIIGGGVVGACLAQDAARRGLSVALIEALDFGCAASEANSHFIHGGIRYLARGEFALVRESLRERAIWRRIAPHLVADRPFLLPLFGDQKLAKRLELHLGAALFEAMAGSGLGRRLSRQETVDCEPVLAEDRLTGSILYNDCQIDLPERAVLSLVADAASRSAVVANHVAAERSIVEGGRIVGLEAVDQLGGGRMAIRARAVINAAGAWSGVVADRLAPGQRSVRLTMSKGIHLVTRSLAHAHALAFSGDGEHAVLAPWGGFTLVGTTDEAYDGNPGEVAVTPADIELLRRKVLRFLPAAAPALDTVLGAFAGVRAMQKTQAGTYRAVRETLFADHAADGAPGLFTLTGGKWTTARAMAEQGLDRIVATCWLSARPCDTARTVLGDVPPGDLLAFRRDWRERVPHMDEHECDLWIGSYGARIGRVVARLGDDAAGHADTREAARFAEAVDNEMAATADDIARRLTRLHAVRRPGVRARAEAWLANRRTGAQVSGGAQRGGAGP